MARVRARYRRPNRRVPSFDMGLSRHEETSQTPSTSALSDLSSGRLSVMVEIASSATSIPETRPAAPTLAMGSHPEAINSTDATRHYRR